MSGRAGFLVALVLLGAMGAVYAAEAYRASTTSDPEIPVEDLELLVKPLRKSELVVEAEVWLGLLREKVRQISAAEIEMKRKGREISDTKETIKEQIDQIKTVEKEEEKDKDDAAESTTDDSEAAQEVAEADEAAEAIEEKIENIEEATEAITESAEDVTEAVVAEIDISDADEVRSSEKEVLEKTEEVEEAKEKLKETAEEVSRSEMDLEEKVKKIGEAEIDLQKKVKEQLLANINKLREEQTGLIDRFRVVMEALEDKGGDITEYDQYVTAISGLKVDVNDVNATRAIIFGWLKSPEGGIRWSKSIVSFVVIIIGFKILSVVMGSITRKTVSLNKKCSNLLREFFVNVVRKAIFVIGIVVALSTLGVNIGPLLAGIGALGFIVGFALQGTLSNFAAGLMILMHRPYDVGDIVSTAGITGYVESMNLNTTTVKTFDNQVVIVPNGSIWGNNIINVTGSETRRVDMVFGISYGDDMSKAQAILEEIVNDHPLVLAEPEPTIKVHELADSSVNFVCRPWTETANFWDVHWDITRTVKERFDTQGISIPFPQQDVYFHNVEKRTSA